MSRTESLYAAAAFALLTVSCDFPSWRECACTEMDCLEGIIVDLRNLPDSTEWDGIAMSVEYGDTVEAEDTLWGFDPRERRAFTSRRLASRRPADIRVHLDYREDGSTKRITLDTSVQWKAEVCNTCSGSSSCKDDMAHTAELTWDLAEGRRVRASPLPESPGPQPPQEVAVPFRQEDGEPSEPASGHRLPQGT